jgi:GTP-binding protein
MKNNFIDRAKILIASGKGGDGCSSFRREKFVEFGGPDGGNGGKGGDIIFVACANLNTLIDFHHKKHFRADSGERGKGRLCFGRAAEDLTIRVPVGTVLIDDETGHELAEFKDDGEKKIILRGGDGGIGNSFFKTSTNRAPRKATPGFEGVEKWIRLELKLFANVGLLGKPNAGKSSFISKSTNYDAKIANYAFTTLKPALGVVWIDQNLDQSFVLADLPGLIEGAASGKGLGLDFLKHIEKCEALLHVIDISGKTPEEIVFDYKMIWNELETYNELLSKKTEIIAFNKIDLCAEMGSLKELQEIFSETLGKDVFLISTLTGEGIKKLNYRLFELIKENKKNKMKNKQKVVYFPVSGYKKKL